MIFPPPQYYSLRITALLLDSVAVRFVQIGKFRLGAIDNTHLSIACPLLGPGVLP